MRKRVRVQVKYEVTPVNFFFGKNMKDEFIIKYILLNKNHKLSIISYEKEGVIRNFLPIYHCLLPLTQASELC